MSNRHEWSGKAEVDAVLAAVQLEETTKVLDHVRQNAGRQLQGISEARAHQERRCLLKSRISWLQSQVTEKQARNAAKRDHLLELESFLKVRHNAVVNARDRLDEEMSWLDSNLDVISRNRESLYHIMHETLMFHSMVAQCIDFIYPVVSTDRKVYTIRDIHLPNSKYDEPHNAEEVATALGWVCHILLVATDTLDAPNRYRIRFSGSRSTITDPISQQEYPLFEKGSSQYHFEYAVYLLNKCIAEILYSRGVPVINLQMTLANLKMILDSVMHANADSVMTSSHYSPLATPKRMATANSVLSPSLSIAVPFNGMMSARSVSTGAATTPPIRTIFHDTTDAALYSVVSPRMRVQSGEKPLAFLRDTSGAHDPSKTPGESEGNAAVTEQRRPGALQVPATSPQVQVQAHQLQPPLSRSFRSHSLSSDTSTASGAHQLHHHLRSGNATGHRGLASSSGEWRVVNGQLKGIGVPSTAHERP